MTDIWDTHLSAIQRVIDDLTGDQSEISKISKRWRKLATGVTTDTGALKRVVSTVNNAWNGGAADDFANHMAKYPQAGTALSGALTRCANELDAAGTALETARGEVQAIYNEKRAWLDEQRNDPDSDTISMTSIRSQVADALNRANGPDGPRQQAIQAVEKATEEVNKYLDEDVKFFSAIPAPGDQGFIPGNNPAMHWVFDPDFQNLNSTTLAGYNNNGSGSQTGGNGYAGGSPIGDNGSGSPTGGNGYGSGGGYQGLKVPANAHSLAKNPRAQSIVDYAIDQIGDRYVWGAEGPNTFDCSGLTLRAYEAAGIDIPRVADDQWLHGPRIPDGKEQAGDLIFFDSTGDGRPDHVGIVLDPEKGTMIHAPNSRSVVRVESYDNYSTPRVGFTRAGMS